MKYVFFGVFYLLGFVHAKYGSVSGLIYRMVNGK